MIKDELNVLGQSLHDRTLLFLLEGGESTENLSECRSIFCISGYVALNAGMLPAVLSSPEVAP